MRWKGRIHFIARSTLPVVLQGNKSVSFHNPSVTNPAMLATCSVCLRQNVYHTTQISAFHVLYKTVNLSSNMILEIPIFSSQTTLKNSKMKNVFTMTLTCTYQVTDTVGSFSACAQSCPTLQPHGLLPIRLLCPWDFQGKNTGVGCHFLFQGMFPTQEPTSHLLQWQEPPGNP